MIKKVSLLLSIYVLSSLVFLADTTSAQETFQYSGYLESDSMRSAYMNISVSGTNVTGSLTLKPVCQSNARLPGAEFNFNGTLNGSWEGKGAISGTWTGTVRWCDKDESRSGSFTISLSQGGVYFSAIGSYYNRYIFTPLEKVYNPSGASSGAGYGTTGGPPSTWKRPTLKPEAPSYASLGPPRTGFQSGIPPNLRENVFGTVELSLNETRLFVMPSGGGWFRTEDRKHVEGLTDCYESGYFSEPGSVLSDAGRVGDGINVKAVGEGIGKVYGSKGCTCIYAGGEKGRCSLMGVWLVVIGERGYAEYTGKKRSTPPDTGPTPDIPRASVSGRTVLRGSKTPVGNAQISLISSQGGSYSRDNWKSKSNGAFAVDAENMLISGVYEVMAFKKSADLGTREDPITVDKDLWPVKRYLVTITKESTQQGVIRVGDIEMDTVDNIFNKGSGRDSSENRDSVKKDTTPVKQGKDTKLPPGGYNPLSDPNLKSPGTSPKSTDIASADKLGGEFQDGQGKSNKSDQGSQQAPINQPDSYTDKGEKKDEGTQKTPYPPGYPPYDYPSGDGTITGTDFTKGVTQGKDDSNWTTSPPCDSSQKQSAYLSGYDCGKRAKQNNGKMTQDCASAFKTYKNMDKKSGWGSCLSGAFDDGYRSSLSIITEVTKESGSGSGSAQGVSAELRNKAGENVHLFIEGQDNFGPHNRLTPGGSRTIKLNVPQGGAIKFVAGRNGQVLARCSWTFNPKSSSSALVTFSGSNSLTCTTK